MVSTWDCRQVQHQARATALAMGTSGPLDRIALDLSLPQTRMQPSSPTACSDWHLWNPPQIAPTAKATANNAGQSARPGPGPGPGERKREQTTKGNETTSPQCVPSRCPVPRTVGFDPCWVLACSGPRLTAEMFPVLLRPSSHSTSTVQPHPSTARPSTVILESSETTRGSDTSRLADSSGLYPPPPPKMSLSLVSKSPRPPHSASR